MKEILLDVSAISVSYGPVRALRDVSLTVSAGEMVALLGANGAGKTTTLRAISGLLSPTVGDISFDGRSIAGAPAHAVVGYGIAHVPEGRHLFASLSVEENLKLGFFPAGRAAPGPYEERAQRVYDAFPVLYERRDQASGTLSGGEQQMLVVGRALMSAPRLLLVDEMSLGLAPMIVGQLFDILRMVNAEGTAVVIVEQFVHLVLANTDRAYVLRKGEVVAQGNSAALAADGNLVSSYLGDEVGS